MFFGNILESLSVSLKRGSMVRAPVGQNFVSSDFTTAGRKANDTITFLTNMENQLYNNGIYVKRRTPSAGHNAMFRTSDKTLRLGKQALLNIHATRQMQDQ